jgi:hypothetical protein
MPELEENLTPADPRDVETALALALTSGKALARAQAAETMSKIVAERLVAQLKSSGFVIHAAANPAPLDPPPSWPHTKPEELK